MSNESRARLMALLKEALGILNDGEDDVRHLLDPYDAYDAGLTDVRPWPPGLPISD